MILVLLGTQNNSFRRLLEKIENCILKGIIQEDVIVQAGNTKFKSERMEMFKYISKDKLQQLIKEANLIITHGGVGSITNCLRLNKIVIAVPRLKQFNEHVNDHQIQIVEEFDNEGYIKGVFDLDNLENEIKQISEFNPKPFINNNSNIIKIITDYIKNN